MKGNSFVNAVLCSIAVTLSSAKDLKAVDRVALVGGRFTSEGNVMVQSDGVFGNVCDDGFGFPEADLVCQELGFEGAESFTRNNHFGGSPREVRRSKSTFLVDNLKCTGASTFRECSSSPLGVHDCVPTELAGVYCRTSQSRCPAREFGCSSGSRCIDRSLVCNGASDCLDGSDERAELCEDVGVVRLKESNTQLNVEGMVAGTVLVKRRGIWGTVCNDDIEVNDAKVLCKSLGYGNGWTLPLYRSYLGEDHSAPVLSTPGCRGTESWVGECPTARWDIPVCREHFNDLSLLCSEAPAEARLQDGRLQIRQIGYNWASLCDTGFDDLDARVICRSLGHDGDASAVRTPRVPGPFWNIIFDCIGHETQLHDCRLRLTNSTCHYAASVSCSSRRGAVDSRLRSVLPSDCGAAEDPSSQYVGRLAKLRGGSAAPRFEDPWLVSFRLSSQHSQGGTLICGGSIISEDYVVTAAHCFERRGKLGLRVRAGDFNSRFVEGSFEQDFPIDKVFVHERYKELDFADNDIALVKIQRQNGRGFTFNERVRPICLPQSDASYDNLQDCRLVGWGESISGFGENTQPRFLSTNVVPDHKCEIVYNGTASYTSSRVCVAEPSGLRIACSGDSGGPLACTNRGRRTLYAVVSSGASCLPVRDHPDKCTRVAKYIRWIQEKVESAERIREAAQTQVFHSTALIP